MNLLLLLTFTIASAQEIERKIYDLTKAREHFDEYIARHQKTYSDEDKQVRFEIFKQHLKHINEENSLNASVFDITEFADLTPDEEDCDCLEDEDDDDRNSPCTIVTDTQLTGPTPPSLDYRDKKVVTPVRSQGQCKCCWAFTSVGCLEGAYAIKHGQLLELAPKQLMDCLQCSGHCKRRGSTMRRAFAELIDQPGVQLEADYPYEAKDAPCNFDASKAKVKVTSCTNFRLQNERKLKEALAQYGPIGIGIYSKPLVGYTGGIVTVEQCPPPVLPERINHAVLLVGYGRENGKEFWVIKNSHGTAFGEGGYVRFEIGKNVCGMLNNHPAAAAVA